jgi:hypothetical protein
VLAHWDGAATTALATFAESGFNLAAGDGQVFVLTVSGLYSVPIAGGAPVMLRAFSSGLDARLLAVSDGSLFYSPDRLSIVRRRIASGNETTIVGGATLPEANRGWADETWLYFLTGTHNQPQTLSRVSVAGGATEVVWDAPDQPPQLAVAGDACNVYWLSASAPWHPESPSPLPPLWHNGPSILMYRRK